MGVAGLRIARRIDPGEPIATPWAQVASEVETGQEIPLTPYRDHDVVGEHPAESRNSLRGALDRGGGAEQPLWDEVRHQPELLDDTWSAPPSRSPSTSSSTPTSRSSPRSWGTRFIRYGQYGLRGLWSQTITLPPGRTTRTISTRARLTEWGSAMWCIVATLTLRSNSPSANGMSVADAWTALTSGPAP